MSKMVFIVYLATNVLTTASTVSANTIAIASVVIMQSMRESVKT